MRVLEFSDSGFWKTLGNLLDDSMLSPEVTAAVTPILEDVKKRGDEAIVEWTEKIDGVRLKPEDFRIPPSKIKAASTAINIQHRKAIKQAIYCVEDFHKKCLPKAWRERNPHGALVGENFYPIERVGIWIPGGSVPLISTVIMTVVLAKLAKVPEVAVFSPPGPGGSISPQLLATFAYCDVDEVYCMGGVMAIGGMAYGTSSIKPVAKIFGPGNAYIVEAKRQVLGNVGIDLLPGPSEVMIIADGDARPDYIAADLLAQAEHGSGKEKVFLATTSRKLIEEVEAAIVLQLPELSHSDAIEKVLKAGAYAILTESLEEAVEVANFVAPEHLELHVDRGSFNNLTKKIYNAGAILVGEHTPTVLGDFTAGPSHTLPTGRTGRFFSGLRVTDFFRRSSIVQYNSKNIDAARPIVEAFSQLEQLDAHGRSLEIRG